MTVDVLSFERRIFTILNKNLEVFRSIIRSDYRYFDLMIWLDVKLISIFWIDPSWTLLLLIFSRKWGYVFTYSRDVWMFFIFIFYFHRWYILFSSIIFPICIILFESFDMINQIVRQYNIYTDESHRNNREINLSTLLNNSLIHFFSSSKDKPDLGLLTLISSDSLLLSKMNTRFLRKKKKKKNIKESKEEKFPIV